MSDDDAYEQYAGYDAEREVSEAELADPEADRYGQKDGQRGILLKEFDDIGSRIWLRSMRRSERSVPDF